MTLADASARVIAERKIPTDGRQAPIPFRIPFNAADINPAHSYSLRATITSGERLLFTSKTSNPVLTRGAGTNVDLMLEQAGGGGRVAGTASLLGTYWKLREIGGASVGVPPNTREAQMTLFAAGKRIAGMSGCNRFMGTFETTAEGTLRLKAGGMTMMACEQPQVKLEKIFIDALNATTGYRIDGEKLELRKGDEVLARFESRYLK